MIVLVRTPHTEGHHDLRIEAFDPVEFKVAAGIKTETTTARGNRRIGIKKIANPAVIVCYARSDRIPVA